jgi:hypothetical protein
VTAAPEWARGDELIRNERKRYRVTSIIPAEDVEELSMDYWGVLEVQPV